MFIRFFGQNFLFQAGFKTWNFPLKALNFFKLLDTFFASPPKIN